MSIEKVTQLPEDFQGINSHNLYTNVVLMSLVKERLTG
jgi:hypothetical protein